MTKKKISLLKKLLFAILLFFASLHAYGQTARLEGTLLDSEDKPLEMATVQLTGKDFFQGTTSDAKGFFALAEIPAGTYTLRVSRIGYLSLSKEIQLSEDEVSRPSYALQQDHLNLEQVVVTGTRNEVPIYESPVIVNEISNHTFETTQSLSLSEGLNFSPGLRVENNCQNCGFTQLRMNGLDGAYSQILINSRPVFSALAGVYGLDMLPANMVERVEVVKGGGSVMYGGNAIAGTVNIITRDPVINSFEIGANQSFINAEASDRTLSFRGSLVSDDLDKGIHIFGYNRNRDHWDANDDGFSEITELHNTTLGFDASFQPNDRSQIRLNGQSINEFRRGGSDFDRELHQSRVAEQLDHRILGGGITYDLYSRNYRHKISLYSSLQHTRRNSYYGAGGRVLTPQDTLTETDLLAINAYGQSRDLSAVGGLQYAFEINEALSLLAGSEYQFNDVTDEMPGYERSIRQRVGTLGAYAQLEWGPFDKLCLLLGGRFDYVHIDGRYDLGAESFINERSLPVAVPRITAKYDLTESLTLRASFAQGYRASQAFDEDLHIETVGGAARFIRLDPELQTERSDNYNLSVNFTRLIRKTQMNLVLEGFHTRLHNPFILSDPQELPSGVSVINKRNGSGAVVQGINLETNFAFATKVLLQSGLTLQSARYLSPEVIWSPGDGTDPTPPTVTENLLRNPNSYGYLTLNYRPVNPLSLTFSGVYTGRMQVPHVVEPESEFTVIEKTPAFFEANFRAAYTFSFQGDFYVELNAGIQNIFNSYQDDFDTGPDRDAGYVYGPIRPRTLFAGMKLGLN